jgi:Putative zinc-finger
MSSSCAQWRGEIGAYVVGALNGDARDRVTRHLAGCAGCRADYDEIVPVRDWLAVAALTAGRPEPSPAGQPGPSLHPPLPEIHLASAGDSLAPTSCQGSCTQLAAQPPDKLRASRPRSRRWLPATGAALAAAAAAVAIAVMVSSGPSARTFRAADSATGVSGHAQLRGTPTGTQIDLTADGLPGHQRCILIAVTRGGIDIAGTWKATYDGSARIAGTTAFPANQLTSLRIESDTGTLLLSIRV